MFIYRYAVIHDAQFARSKTVFCEIQRPKPNFSFSGFMFQCDNRRHKSKQPSQTGRREKVIFLFKLFQLFRGKFLLQFLCFVHT